MPGGGYVRENGISVCTDCHEKAEQWWQTGYEEGPEGFSREDLYEIIGSSLEEAYKASERLVAEMDDDR